MRMRAKHFRFLQLITGIHYIHHYQYSFGWKIPFTKMAWFVKYGIQNISNIPHMGYYGIEGTSYHNCTLNGY